MFNGATVHGFRGIRTLRHPAEIPLLIATSMATALAYLSWIALVIWLVAVPEPTGLGAQVRDFFLSEEGRGAQFLLLVPLIPIILWVGRAMLYAKLRATAVQMSPTQFPEGYRMVVEAAQQFGMRRVPDAYVIMGNGQINAFAAGHGYRRFVVVHSDMFEIGGRARDPEALRFVIGHEVGHLAADDDGRRYADVVKGHADHGGRRRLAVRARDSDAVVFVDECRIDVRTMEATQAEPRRLNDLGIRLRNRRRDDDGFCPMHVL